MQVDSGKWTGKDMIAVGVYTAIYFVLIAGCAFMGLVPILMVAYAFLAPIIGAVPMMIYYTKIKKFGMLSVTGIVTGALVCVTGMGIYPFLFSIVSSLLAEFILKAGKYRSVKAIIASYSVFSFWLLGNYIPLFIDPASYFATRKDYGQAYEDALRSYLPMWMLPVMAVGIIIFAAIGAWIAKGINKKHFEKAGLV